MAAALACSIEANGPGGNLGTNETHKAPKPLKEQSGPTSRLQGYAAASVLSRPDGFDSDSVPRRRSVPRREAPPSQT